MFEDDWACGVNIVNYPTKVQKSVLPILAIRKLKRDSWNLKYLTQQILVCNGKKVLMVLAQACIFLKIIKASFVKG